MANGKTTNLARSTSTTYEVSTGSYWQADNNDLYNALLTDGKLNSGNKTVVNYCFWRQPEDEGYISVNMDLKRNYEVSKIILHGLNHSSLYRVNRCLFQISTDGIDYKTIAEFPAKGGVIPQKQVGTWKIEAELVEKARFIRVTAWSDYWLNLEELEVYGEGDVALPESHTPPAPQKPLEKQQEAPVEITKDKIHQTSGITTNLARKQGVTYEVSTGSYWEDANNDLYNTMLTDGILNSGNKAVVVYCFYRQPEDEGYISVNMDLKKNYEVSKIILHGLNHSSLYRVNRCLFQISTDGIDYKTIAEYPAKGGSIPQKQVGTWKIETELAERARFIRITAWSDFWLNFEELEVYGKEMQ